jgi:RNA polymerase sigma-70 factor (ECF subfamily)
MIGRMAGGPTPKDVLQAALAAAREAWPGFDLPPARAREHLERAFPDGPPQGGHLRDLCLAWGCLEGDRAALAALQGLLDETRRRLARDGDAVQADEAVQALSEGLLAQEGKEPLISQYRGAGPLAKWLLRAAANRALKLIRADRSRRKHERMATAGESPDPELDVLRATYRQAFEESFAAAVAGLPAERRRLLRLHYLDGFGVQEAAKVLEIHRATASRWLDEARRELLEGVRTRLVSQLELSGGELNQLLALAQSKMKITLSRIFKTGGGKTP